MYRENSGAIYKIANIRAKKNVLYIANVIVAGSTAILCLLGLLFVFSSSSVDAITLYGNPFEIFVQQLIWMVLGLVVALLFFKIKDYQAFFFRYANLALIVSYVLLLLVLIPGIGTRALGSSRWIGISVIHVQPSELIKFTLLIFVAKEFTTAKGEFSHKNAKVRRALLYFCIAAFLIALQPDLGTDIVLSVIFFSLIFLAGISVKFLLKTGIIFGAFAVLFALAAPYRRARLTSFLNPFSQPLKSGYQVVQSLVSIGSGHIIGNGLGNSTFKWGFLPNSHTDFIFSVIGQELGLVGSIFVILLFACLTWAGFRIAMSGQNIFERLLVGAMTAWLASQSIINIGATLGLLPVTGIPLAFVSFGGSALILNILGAAIILRVGVDLYRKSS